MTVGVALSFTPAGRAALRLAAREAALRGASLSVLQVAEKLEQTSDPAALAAVRGDVEALLAEGGAPGDLRWSLRSAPNRGDIASALLGLADEAGADLLVIGAKRRNPVGKLIMGSTVQRVILDAPIPVLVVKPDA